MTALSMGLANGKIDEDIMGHLNKNHEATAEVLGLNKEKEQTLPSRTNNEFSKDSITPQDQKYIEKSKELDKNPTGGDKKWVNI